MSGFIKEEDINEVRERNDLVEVVSGYVNLKKAGRLFKGLCPFHKEKTPSFVVDPAKQLYYCFGCGEGGNVYNFLMKIENIDFPESVQMLAERTNYSLCYECPSGSKAVSRKERLHDMNELAQRFYNHILLETNEGERAKKYLKNRGFKDRTFEIFKLGYASSDGKKLLRFLTKKGYGLQELIDVGLVVKGDKSSHDLFRNRIIFPITDLKGKAIAFGGRVIDKALPKYINTPDTTLFHKSSTLYNQFLAKSEIVKSEYALVVEGYTDVISLYQAGIKNVVATLGTAFTSEHLHLLSRFTNKVVLLFDADKAGIAAAERGLGLLGQSKVDVFVVSLPSGKDPADFIASEGESGFRKRLDESKPLIEFCLDLALAKHDLKEPLERAKAVNDSVEIIALLENAVLREDYLRKLEDRLNISYESLLSELKKVKREKIKGENTVVSATLDAQVKSEREALKFILQYSDKADQFLLELTEEYFTYPEYRDLFLFLKNISKERLNSADLINSISDKRFVNLITLLSLEPINVDIDSWDKYFSDILIKLKDFSLKRQIYRLKSKLKEADSVGDVMKVDKVFDELIKLEKKRRELKQCI